MNKVCKRLTIILIFLLFAPYHLKIQAYAALPTSASEAQTVDSAGNVGLFSSLTLDSGNNPHISYFDSTNHDLKYASRNGSSWVIETVDSEGYVGESSSLALDSNGYPHISYYDSLNKDVKYAVKDGSGWSIQVVDSKVSGLYATSISLDSTDKPHIVYTEYDNLSLKYAVWTGSIWSIQTVNSPQYGGGYCSSAVDSIGHVHISYQDAGNLNYASWNGSDWNIQIVDEDGGAGYFSSIVLDSDNKPCIAYFTGELKYAALKGSSWDIQVVDKSGMSGSVGWWPSTALDSEGKTHISYFNTVDGLRYAIQTDSGWFIQNLDTAGNEYSSIALDTSGYTHISYFDRSNGDLKYVVVSSNPADAITSSIRIMSDGAVEGTVKILRNGDKYTFNDDIDVYLSNYLGELKGCLLVEKDNIVIDGAGHTLKGNGTGVGIYLRSMQNVTIKNLKIEGFVIGISSYIIDPPFTEFRRPIYRSALNIKIADNEITAVAAANELLSGFIGGWGLFLEFAENTAISGNVIRAQDPAKGLFVGSCNNTVISENRLIGCGLYFQNLKSKDVIQNIIDGKPVVFLKNTSNQVVDCAEQVFLYNCTGINIKNVNPSANYHGAIQLEETANSNVTKCGGNIVLTNANNNTIRDCTPHSIELEHSSYNKISSNTIIESGQCLKLSASSNFNDIYGNIISDSKTSPEATDLFNSGKNTLGIQISDSQHNNIYENSLVNHVLGLDCDEISDTKIYDNIISECNTAISLYASNNNSIIQNNITESGCGVSIYGGGGDNTFLHNNFINNRANVYEEHKTGQELLYGVDFPDVYSQNNTWDAEYPIGGNYWSDYNGTDEDADGIGDTAYRISEDYVDHYPLMKPFIVPEHSEVVDEENRSAPYENDKTIPDEAGSPTPNTEPAITNWIVVVAVSVVSVAVAGLGMFIFLRKRKQ